MPTLDEALPKYRQIAHHFRDQILRGDLQSGDEIPSERAIAAQFSVARPTATKALELLRQDGLVESVQGSGTFVVDQRPNRRARERYERSRSQGKVYPPGEFAVIVAAELVEAAPDHVIEALGLTAGSGAVRRRRIINNDGGPIEVSTSWFDGALAAPAARLLLRERIREGTLSYVEGVSGRRGEYARDRVSAREATEEERTDLGLPHTPTPVLTVHHVVYDQADHPLEFAEAVYPPGRWAYEQEYSLS